MCDLAVKCRSRLSAALLVAVVAAEWRTCVRAQARTLTIGAIQGPGSRSPVEGQLIITSGVVTGRKTNGFFVQSPDDSDGDARTSEGVFVFTGAAPAATLTPGTLVSVTGRVIEFVPAADPSSPPLTEIGETPVVEVRGVGHHAAGARRTARERCTRRRWA